nr:glycosyltransferase family 2 protein [Agrobacterium tumefaciens]
MCYCCCRGCSSYNSTRSQLCFKSIETAEVIIVDDASTDDTLRVAKMCDDGSGRLRVVRLELNRGPSSARNFAISISTSPVISILDADDFFLPGRLSNLIQHTEWDMIAESPCPLSDTDERPGHQCAGMIKVISFKQNYDREHETPSEKSMGSKGDSARRNSGVDMSI